jgi:endonuclease YncB( thermonuclease family)
MNRKAMHSRWRWRHILLGAALVATRAAHAASLASPASGPCSLENTTHAIVAKIEPNLDILLADGRVVSLAGIDPPRDTPEHPRLASDARDNLARWLEGRDVALRPLAPAPNRWGRVPARLFAAPPGTSSDAVIGVSEALLDAGLARYRPDGAAGPCRAELLAAEADARDNKLGLWGDPYYAVLPAGDRTAFAILRSGMVLVEGTVTSLGETATRFYLNFGPGRGVDFAITLPKRSANGFEKAGIKVRELVGHRVRVRGLLDRTYGPQMEMDDADGLETLD